MQATQCERIRFDEILALVDIPGPDAGADIHPILDRTIKTVGGNAPADQAPLEVGGDHQHRRDSLGGKVVGIQ